MKELTAPFPVQRLHLAVGVICLFHVCGLIGFYTPFREWFLSNTPLNLVLATGLLLWNHQGLTIKMVLGAMAVFLVGLTAEIIGVRTGLVFGAYHYGEAFGFKFMAVPLVIGMNWAALCFASAAVVNQWERPFLVKAAVAAAVPVSIDFLIEQVCEKFDFWYWDGHTPPLQNYLAWYGFSFLFALVLIPLLKNSRNPFAPYFLLVQFVFFLLLNVVEFFMPDKPLTYDYIIAGAGAAGLSLMCHLLGHPELKTKRILLLDRDAKQANDRTWCFWQTGESPFDGCLKSQWNQLYFHSPQFSALLDISPYRYKMLDSLSFYQHCFGLMEKFPNVEFRQDEIVSLDPEGVITGKKAVYRATYVFNSVLFQIPKLAGKHYLVQHFKGIFIKTAQPVFNPAEPTLMGFRVAQHQDCRFMYVLPVNAYEALVEYTGFSEEALPQEEYDQELKQYLEQYLRITDFDITHEEFGIIPMTDAPFSKGLSERVINIGTAGGATKASTGYTFSFIQRQCAAIAQNLAQGRKPLAGSAKTIDKFAFYDSVFLRVLLEKKLAPWEIFHSMFSKLPASLILKFLNEETSLWEDLRIMHAMDQQVFLAAAVKQAAGK